MPEIEWHKHDQWCSKNTGTLKIAHDFRTSLAKNFLGHNWPIILTICGLPDISISLCFSLPWAMAANGTNGMALNRI